MPLFLLPYPVIDPVMINLGPLPIRWYALGYIVSLVVGWMIAQRLVRSDSLWGGRPRPSAESLDDLLVFVAFGAVLGGRTGYVLFYNLPFFLAESRGNPAIVEGRHVVSRRPGRRGARRLAVRPTDWACHFLSVGDLCCAVAPHRACSWCASPISSSRSCGVVRPTFPGR